MPDVRLIDANALKPKMTVDMLGGHKRIWVCGVIDDAPTIDAQPVKHGEWVVPKNDDEQPYCSVCNWHAYGDLFTDYCPGCGYTMEGIYTEEAE